MSSDSRGPVTPTLSLDILTTASEGETGIGTDPGRGVGGGGGGEGE